jgi:GTPase SAR1 family protein
VYVSLLALKPKADFDSCYDDLKQGNVFWCRQVVIVGNGAVGKSSMIQRYCKGTFTKDYKKTIGVDFLERQIE